MTLDEALAEMEREAKVDLSNHKNIYDVAPCILNWLLHLRTQRELTELRELLHKS